MNIFNLARTITNKVGGDTIDFIDYAVIIRNWMDKNYTLSCEIQNGNSVSNHSFLTDKRFETLRKRILEKPLHSKKEID